MALARKLLKNPGAGGGFGLSNDASLRHVLLQTAPSFQPSRTNCCRGFVPSPGTLGASTHPHCSASPAPSCQALPALPSPLHQAHSGSPVPWVHTSTCSFPPEEPMVNHTAALQALFRGVALGVLPSLGSKLLQPQHSPVYNTRWIMLLLGH